MKITGRVEKITPSATLEITSLAKSLREQGHAVINFAAGEPDFDTPQYIKAAAIEAIKKGFTKYTPASGLLELRKAISKKLSTDNHLQYSPSQIIVSCGAKHALYNIFQATCRKGDEVLISSPYWVSYPEMVNLAEARVHIIKTKVENKFKLNSKSLLDNINKRTKFLILNSPGNPTGCVYSSEELKEIAEIVVERNLYVISDEVYERLIFDEKKHISIASLNEQIYKRTIVVNGVSKAYAMTGWRIGYLASCDKHLIQAINKLQSHSTSNPCSISQKAACKALQRPRKKQFYKMVKEFQIRRDVMLKGLQGIDRLSFVKPEGAFYVFCNISRLGLDPLTFAQRLLNETKIAVIPGVAFGRDDYIRLSFATSLGQIKDGIRRLKAWVKNI